MPTKRISFTEAEATPAHEAIAYVLDHVKDLPELDLDAYEIAALSRAATKIKGAIERSARENEQA